MFLYKQFVFFCLLIYSLALSVQDSQAKQKQSDHSLCPRSSRPFYIETYYIKPVTTSWTHSKGRSKYRIRRRSGNQAIREFFMIKLEDLNLYVYLKLFFKIRISLTLIVLG